jgi:hypothetical protein
MTKVTNDIWVNIANVIWVQDVYDTEENYQYTKIVTIGGDIILNELNAEQVSEILKVY